LKMIICKDCNGSGRADTMGGASECQNCGGDGHCLRGLEGMPFATLRTDIEKEMK
jgi:DnaJ-class molecular chaperone